MQVMFSHPLRGKAQSDFMKSVRWLMNVKCLTHNLTRALEYHSRVIVRLFIAAVARGYKYG